MNIIRTSIFALMAAISIPQNASASMKGAFKKLGIEADADTQKKFVANQSELSDYLEKFQSQGVGAKSFLAGRDKKISDADILTAHAGETHLTKLLGSKATADDQVNAAFLINSLKLNNFTLNDLNSLKALKPLLPQDTTATLLQLKATELLLNPQLDAKDAVTALTLAQVNYVADFTDLHEQKVIASAIQSGFGTKAAGTLPNGGATLTSIANDVFTFQLFNGPASVYAADATRIVKGAFSVALANFTAFPNPKLNSTYVFSNLQNDAVNAKDVTLVDAANIPAVK